MVERKPVVLVVDDEAQIREFYARILEEEGYATVAAADGREAIAALDRQVPSAVILDMSMPNASGLAVLQRIREREETRHLPVIVATGVDRDDDLWGGREWGWDLYMTKPIDFAELVAALHKLIPNGR